MSVSEQAMLVSLSISCWTATRKAQSVADNAEAQNRTAKNVVKAKKLLVPESALEPVTKAATAARTYLYDNTLPWGRNGAQLLPSAHYFTVAARIRELRLAYEGEVEAFLQAYPMHKANGPARMGDLYSPADYPSEYEIRRRFGFGVEFEPLPATGDWRIEIGDSERARLIAEAEARQNGMVQAAMADLWTRLHKVVENMAGSLRDYVPSPAKGIRAQGVFRDSLVENIRELVSILPAMNFTGDPALTQLTRAVEASLCQHDAAELRSDDQLRASITAEADALLAQMAGFAAPVGIAA